MPDKEEPCRGLPSIRKIRRGPDERRESASLPHLPGELIEGILGSNTVRPANGWIRKSGGSSGTKLEIYDRAADLWEWVNFCQGKAWQTQRYCQIESDFARIEGA